MHVNPSRSRSPARLTAPCFPVTGEQTYIGHVLISVNPYKMIKQLYTEQTLRDYRGKYRYELPPHVYPLADDMYRSMMSEGENQCVIIRYATTSTTTKTTRASAPTRPLARLVSFHSPHH